MNPVRAPWQVWGAIALFPVLWLLYQQPGDPLSDMPTRAAVLISIGCLFLLLGSKIAWVIGTAYTGAVGVIFIYHLFDPMSNPSSTAVHLAFTAVTVSQFALLVAAATMDWVGVRDRRTAGPPTAPSG